MLFHTKFFESNGSDYDFSKMKPRSCRMSLESRV